MKPNMGFVLLMLRVSPCTKLKHESKSTSMIFLRLIRKQGIDSLKGSKACGLLYMAGWIVYDACRLMNKMKCSTWYSQKIYERRDTHTHTYIYSYLHPHQKISTLFLMKPVFLKLLPHSFNFSTLFWSTGIGVEFPVLPPNEIV